MENEFWNELRSCTTCGQILADDRVIDLLASGESLEIVVFDGERSFTVPQFEHEGVLYRPPELHPTVRRATRFPTRVSEYASTVTLLSKVSQLCSQYFGLPEVFASTAASWVFSSWVPELFAAPPTLCIAACSMAEAMRFFRLLGALCRRAITVATLNQQLPLVLRPTLLLVEAGLSKKVRASWRACTYHGVYVPASGGALAELVCSKAIYSETADAIGSWGDEALRIVLLPTSGLPVLGEPDLEAIADEFQPQFELYRLRRLRPRSGSVRDRCPADMVGSGLGRELFMLLAGESGIPKLLLPVVKQQQQTITARRSVDPLAVILEVIWAPAHEQSAMVTSEVRQRVNVLLRARGEKVEYSVKEIGWKLSDLGLRRHRNAKGMFLRFSRELRRQIHDLAGQFGLTLPKVNGCPECAPVQIIEPQAAV